MNIREKSELLEHKILSEFAAKSSESKGRECKEEECDVRTIFQRDRDRILHSKAFRRLKQKTQVFLAPEGDHYRTRLTHTLEVSQISRTIAKALNLNEDLTEAIALGHDLGHTPFGHCGEAVLDKLVKKGFKHNVQSLRVVDILEGHNEKNGLNLCMEVRDGILNHTGEIKPVTLEGQIVKISDRVAYLNHDIDDSLRAGIIKYEDIPHKIITVLGNSYGKRINTMTKDIIISSNNKNEISMSDKLRSSTEKLREFMFEKVYFNEDAKGESSKAEKLIRDLFNYYMNNICEISKSEKDYNFEEKETLVKDYIAGMTDRFAINIYLRLFVPEPWDR